MCTEQVGLICGLICVYQSVGSCLASVCLSLYVLSNQTTSKNRVIRVKHKTQNTQQGAVSTKVPRLNMFRPIISLSKITH